MGDTEAAESSGDIILDIRNCVVSRTTGEE